jgi:hypothetical protein
MPEVGQLISSSSDGTIWQWDVASGTVLRTVNLNSGAINDLALARGSGPGVTARVYEPFDYVLAATELGDMIVLRAHNLRVERRLAVAAQAEKTTDEPLVVELQRRLNETEDLDNDRRGIKVEYPWAHALTATARHVFVGYGDCNVRAWPVPATLVAQEHDNPFL